MAYCLFPPLADKFKKMVAEGKINPEELSAMESAERRKFFENIVGEENAKNVNALFESKLLLKNQKKGMVNWVKTLTGMKEEVKRDILSKITKLDKVLNPEEESMFLKDLADKRLGVSVTAEEAKTISNLAKVAEEAKSKMDPKTFKFSSKEAGDKFGASQVLLENYMKDLKLATSKTKLKEYFTPSSIEPAIEELGGAAKSLKASLDDSAVFRQGWKAMWSNPIIWSKNAVKTIPDFMKAVFGGEIKDAVKADVYSRENSLNGIFKKMKLDIGNVEEAYPISIPEKIPILGRLFKASEEVYTSFLYRLRADIADQYVKIAQHGGVDVANEFEARSMGKVINSLTGRGDLGSWEKAGKSVNNIFFSAKFFKSNLDYLTAHTFTKGGLSPFARKQAAKNLLKGITGMATIMGVANALRPGTCELDPRSSDFGKIKIGDTRFDISAGMSSFVTLATRIIRQSSKTSTGEIQELGNKFGQKKGMDLLWDFTQNKFSPTMAVIKDLINQQDFLGNKPTVKGELSNFLLPLPIANYQELAQNPNSANMFLAIMADEFGIVTNTYSKNPPYKKLENILKDPSSAGLDDSTSTRVKALKTQVDENTFNKASAEYEKNIQSALEKVTGDSRYQKMNDEEKKKQLQHIIGIELDDILKKYNYKPTKPAKPINYIK